MDFTYDDEQDALRDAVRGLIGKAYSDYEHRRQTTKEDPGFDEKVWTQLAEMGLLGLPFSEDDGGVGAGPVEIGIVCQELGRVIAPEPFLGSVVLAGGLVSAVGTPEQRQEILGALAAGDTVLAFAHAEPGAAVVRLGHRRHRAAGRRQLDRQRHQGRRPARRPRRRAGRQRRAARRRHRPVPGRRARDAEREGYATYDGGRAARVTFDATAATPLGEAGRRRHRQHRDGARHHPDHGRQPGARGDADPAQGDHGLPQEPQAVRRHPQHLPGAHLPRRRHVHLPGAHPQPRRLGHDGRRRAATPPRSPTPPPGSGCRSAAAVATSARRRSSCTAASP